MTLEQTIRSMERIEKNIHNYNHLPEIRSKMIDKYRELYEHATTKQGLKHPDPRYGKSTNWLALHEKVGVL